MVNWQWCLASSLCRGSKALSSAALLSSSSRVVAFRERCRRRTGIAFATDIATRLPRICPATNRGISSSEPCKDTVRMTFVEDDGNVVEVEAEPGQTLLEVAHENDVDLEGACGGDLACSTCHVVLPQEFYEKLGEKSEEEEDMLDLAWGLTDTSRLGCQIKVSQELEGMKIKIPEDSVDLS